MPFGDAARVPSDTDEPTITRLLTIAGGDVTEYSPP
jgi:hypothetical protein